MLRKWLATIFVNWNQFLAYKLDFLATAIIPAVLFFVIKYNLFETIYSSQDAELIAGYSVDQMLQYQAWVLILTLLTSSFSERNLAEDIRLGRISSYLIYPFDFWQFHTASFLAFTSLQIFVAGVSLALLLSLGILPSVNLEYLLVFIFLCCLVAVFWFLIRFAVGLLSFWFDETWTFRMILSAVVNFFAGVIFPLDMFPSWLQNILYWTPFPYMTYFPAKIIMGDATTDQILLAIFALTAWMILIGFLVRFTWKRGLRLYSAAGM